MMLSSSISGEIPRLSLVSIQTPARVVQWVGCMVCYLLSVTSKVERETGWGINYQRRSFCSMQYLRRSALILAHVSPHVWVKSRVSVKCLINVSVSVLKPFRIARAVDKRWTVSVSLRCSSFRALCASAISWVILAERRWALPSFTSCSYQQKKKKEESGEEPSDMYPSTKMESGEEPSIMLGLN